MDVPIRKLGLFAVSVLVLVAITLLASGQGSDPVSIAEDRFPDVDIAAISEGRVGSPLTEADLTTTAAFRAMCTRTLNYLDSGTA